MSAEFVGTYDLGHVAQPDRTNKCFAATLSSVAKIDLPTAHAALLELDLSEKDGTTGPFFDSTNIPIAPGLNVVVEPIVTPFNGGDNTEAALSRIHKELEVSNPVALLHKKTADPSEREHHWILLTSRISGGNGPQIIGVMDPKATRNSFYPIRRIENLVDRTVKYAGINACALVVEKPNVD